MLFGYRIEAPRQHGDMSLHPLNALPTHVLKCHRAANTYSFMNFTPGARSCPSPSLLHHPRVITLQGYRCRTLDMKPSI